MSIRLVGGADGVSLWHEPGRVRVSREFRDGQDWSIKTVPVTGEHTGDEVEAMTLEGLLMKTETLFLC